MSLRELPQKINEYRLGWGITSHMYNPEKAKQLDIDPERGREWVEKLLTKFNHRGASGEVAGRILALAVAGAPLEDQETEKLLRYYVEDVSDNPSQDYPGDWCNIVKMFVHVPNLPPQQLERLWKQVTESPHWGEVESPTLTQQHAGEERARQQLEVAHTLLEQEKLPPALQTEVVDFMFQKLATHARPHAFGNRLGFELRDKLYEDSQLRNRPGIRRALIQHASQSQKLSVLAQDRSHEDMEEIFRRLCEVNLSAALKWVKHDFYDVRQRLGPRAPTLIMTHPQADHQILRELGELKDWSGHRTSSQDLR